jgi:hypothetical protein
MVGDIISERWAELSRNGGRHHSGIMGDIARNRQLGYYGLEHQADACAQPRLSAFEAGFDRGPVSRHLPPAIRNRSDDFQQT